MKILFANSPLSFMHGHTFLQPDWPTLILPTLAAIAGNKHKVCFSDNMRFVFKSNDTLKQVGGFGPDAVGFSIIAAADIFNTLKVIKDVRRRYPRKIIFAGGQAGTFYHELLLKNGVNFVVNGEAEVTLRELIEALENNSGDFSRIRGLYYSAEGNIMHTGEREFLANLDDSPMPVNGLMPDIKSRWFKGRFTGAIEMSRGCPFNCSFCAITHYWKRTFREKSNGRIMEELRVLKRLNRTHVYLADDNFAMNADKHTALFEAMLKEGLDIKFFAQIRTDTIAKNPEMIALAARAGFYGALVGFDTYEPKVYRDIDKVGSEELNIRASEVLRKNKIAIFGTHVYAFPSQKSPKDFSRTFWMGRKYSDCFRMPLFSPHPGTPAYSELVSKGMIDPEKGSDLHKLTVGGASYRRAMTRGYYFYQLLHAVMPDEIWGALFHPNPAVRKLKFYSYVMALRFVFYKLLRTLRLCDI